MSNRIKNIPLGQDEAVLRLPLPWLQLRSMRGPAFTMASLVTWCANGDNTFDPRIWQIASRSGLSTRQTQDHIRLLGNQGWIARSRKVRRVPTVTTIQTSYFDWLYSGTIKYLELPVGHAQTLGCEGQNVGLLARCVVASAYNELQLQQRIRDQNKNGDALELCDAFDSQRIARELKSQRRHVDEALSALRSCGAAPTDSQYPESTPQ